ncbi:948_t:CDS:2, partial [Acaulospora morrowiae]
YNSFNQSYPSNYENSTSNQNRVYTVRPVSIKHLLSSELRHPDGERILDGKPLEIVTFVARINDIPRTADSENIVVEDGSGSIQIPYPKNTATSKI